MSEPTTPKRVLLVRGMEKAYVKSHVRVGRIVRGHYRGGAAGHACHWKLKPEGHTQAQMTAKLRGYIPVNVEEACYPDGCPWRQDCDLHKKWLEGRMVDPEVMAEASKPMVRPAEAVQHQLPLRMAKAVVLLRRMHKALASSPKPKPNAADKPKSSTPHFSGSELNKMGLKWVTAHPNGPGTDGTPILVRDLGDEMQVVGGAGGKLNFTRFKKRGEGEEAAKPKKAKVAAPPVSPEDATRIEGEKQQARAKAKDIKLSRREHIEQLVGQTAEVTPEEVARIEKLARKLAKQLGVSDDGTDAFIQKTQGEYVKGKKETLDAAAQAVERKALEMQAHAALGAADGEGGDAVVEPSDAAKQAGVQPVHTHLSPEDALKLARSVLDQRAVEADIRAADKALRSGDEEAIRAVELTYEPLTDEEVSKQALGEHVARAEVEVNNALVEATKDPTRRMSKDLHAGAADTAAALASEIAGTAILDNDTCNELGVAGSSRVIAEYLAEKLGGHEAAAKALREYIGQHSSAVASAAVKSSERLRGLAEEMRGFGGNGAGALCAKAQANAKALEYTNEAQRLCSRTMGGLETAAQVALNLERGQQGPLTVPGRSTEAGTREKAANIGLSKGEYAVKRGEHGWDLIVDEKAFPKLYHERTYEQHLQDEELQDIRRRQQGEGWPEWTPEGQSPNVQLAPHQQADIKFWERQKNVLIADEAGSGKTATILCGIADLHKQGKVKRAVIVVPKSVALQFGTEIAKFLGPEYQDQFVIASGKSRAARIKAYNGPQLFTIITHDTLRSDANDIKEAAPEALAVDEAHYFSVRGEAGGSQRSLAAREIDAPYKALLTGTPIKNDLSELFSLVDWMQPGVVGTKKEFTDRYGALATGTGMFDASLMKNLSDRLSGVMLGVKLSVQKGEGGDVHFELTPEPGAAPVEMKENTEFLPLSAEQQSQYQGAEKDYLGYRDTQKAAGFKRDGALERVVNNVETTEHPKVKRLQQILDTHKDQKAVVFASNSYAWNTIVKGLGLKAGEYELLTGDDSDKERKRKQDALNDPKSKVRILVASDAANFGLNLQGASVLVNFDATDTSATHEQRIAREFRRGQKHNVDVYNLRTKTPLEIKAQERIQRKAKVSGLPHQLQHADESGLAPLLAAALAERPMEKSLVKAHTRTLKSGKVVHVREHSDKRGQHGGVDRWESGLLRRGYKVFTAQTVDTDKIRNGTAFMAPDGRFFVSGGGNQAHAVDAHWVATGASRFANGGGGRASLHNMLRDGWVRMGGPTDVEVWQLDDDTAEHLDDYFAVHMPKQGIYINTREDPRGVGVTRDDYVDADFSISRAVQRELARQRALLLQPVMLKSLLVFARLGGAK